MIINFRQGLITSPVNFLIAGGGFAHINIDLVPVLACVSNGSSDYLIEESSSVSNAWGPILSAATHYLYWDINRVTGAITRGMTTLSPAIGASEPVGPAVGQMWWNSVTAKMQEWNGNRWVEVLRVFAGTLTGSTVVSYDAGSQVGISQNSFPGKIVFDGFGRPLRMQNGGFVTSEVEMTLPQSGSLVKLDGAFITAKANENLPKNSIVYFVPGTNDRVGLASGIYPDVEIKTPIGFVQVATYQNEPVNLITAGRLVADELWNWDSSLIGKSVYCDSTGGLTTLRNGEKTMRVGTIFSKNSVMLSFDWETQPSQIVGNTVSVNGLEPIYITGSAAAPVVNVRYADNSTDGVITGSQFQAIMAAVTELPNKSNIGHTHSIAQVSGLQVQLDSKSNIDHTHVAANITDLQPLLDAKADTVHIHAISDVSGLSTTLAGKSNINHTHDIVNVNGLQLELDSKAPLIHLHEIAEVNGLQFALNGKSDVGHTHTVPQIDGLVDQLNAKSDISHTHSISNVVGLQSALDSKAPFVHTHFISDIDGLSAALSNKSNVGHLHEISDVNALQLTLDSKSNVGHNHAIGEITGLQIVLDNKSNVGHSHSLGSLTDVDLSSGMVGGEVLTYDVLAGKWYPGTSSSGGGLPAPTITGYVIANPSLQYEVLSSSGVPAIMATDINGVAQIIPSNGIPGQILSVAAGTNPPFEWVDPTGGGSGSAPIHQVLVGTGSGTNSDIGFKYNIEKKALYVNLSLFGEPGLDEHPDSEVIIGTGGPGGNAQLQMFANGSIDQTSDVYFFAGEARATNSNGGDMTIYAGNGSTDNQNRRGGSLSMWAGNGDRGGDVYINAGRGYNDFGGEAALQAGDSQSAAHDGGNAILQAGWNTADPTRSGRVLIGHTHFSAPRFEINHSGAWTIKPSFSAPDNFGNPGDVLTSAGATGIPYWAPAAGGGASIMAGVVRARNISSGLIANGAALNTWDDGSNYLNTNLWDWDGTNGELVLDLAGTGQADQAMWEITVTAEMYGAVWPTGHEIVLNINMTPGGYGYMNFVNHTHATHSWYHPSIVPTNSNKTFSATFVATGGIGTQSFKPVATLEIPGYASALSANITLLFSIKYLGQGGGV